MEPSPHPHPHQQAQPHPPSPPSQPSSQPIADLEWEEYDPQTHPPSFTFFHHCLAGSFAGVAEHTLLYPLDTVKTCWQSQVLHNAQNAMNAPNAVVKGLEVGEPPSCGSCEIHQTFSKFSHSATPAPAAVHSSSRMMDSRLLTKAASPVSSSSMHHSLPSTATAATHHIHHHHPHHPNQQGIWSTMKHLMHHGHHNQGSHHPLELQRGVYTLAQHATSFEGAASSIASTAATAHGDTAASNGVKRLFRGVQTMFVGCIPAHALYFSSYEMIKKICLEGNATVSRDQNEKPLQNHHHPNTLSPTQAMVAGTVATLLHDFIMTPMDTIKQRMQLGHYKGLRDAFASIVWGDVKYISGVDGGKADTTMASKAIRTGGEGWKGLYRSFPITVMTNVPYGMIMMTTNEWLRGVLEDGLYGVRNGGGGDDAREEDEGRPFHFTTILLSGMGAGTVAAAATAPLDRVKTRLQTQRMGMVIPPGVGVGSTAVMEERALAAAKGERKVCPKMMMRDVKQALRGGAPTTTSVPSISAVAKPLAQTPFTKTYYTTPLEAFRSILQEEGYRGLFRGTVPRVALHAPSVAISWTAYEMAKGWLVWCVD